MSRFSRRQVGAFFGELSRRRVFRVAAWYAAAAWVVIQATTTVFPILGVSAGAEKVVLAIVILAAPITFALAWYFDITPEGVQRTESRAVALRQAAAAQPRTLERSGKSIVVLPFRDLSAGEQDYFADGVTEDIIAALTCVRDVRVISRTSAMQYRSTEKTVPQIAAELGVRHVLEGSIRRAGQRVRIVAQLIEAASDEHIWAETYDRQLEDIFAIQSEVAQHIAQSLDAELSGAERARLARAPTQRLDAYDAYLRGRHLWNQRTARAIREAITSFQHALTVDPEFTMAWAALAEAFVTLALYGVAAPAEVMPQARQAAQRALALDAALVEARTPLAAVLLHYDWDWAGAEREYERAIEGNPRYPTAHHWYANLLAAGARFDEARAALERARELDPISPAILTSAGIISYFAEEQARATTELELVIARYPAFPLAHMFLGLVLLQQSRPAEARERLHTAVELSGGTAETRAALACGLAASGQHEEARALLHALRQEPFVSPVLLANVLTALAEPDAALAELRAAVGMRAADLVWTRVRPLLRPLRERPELAAVLRPVFDATAISAP